MQDTKKAFRNLQKKNDLQSAANVLCNIKGVGPAMASGEPQRLHQKMQMTKQFFFS